MPKAGKYDYPVRDLDDCLNYLEKAHKVSQSFTMKRDNFARAIGLSPLGGGFGSLLGSMAMFGLIETGEGDIRYTELAQKILFGEAKEKEELKNKAVRNVRMLGEIYDRFGDNPTTENLRHFLREKAEVHISKEESLASEVGKLLKKVVQHLKPVGGGNKEMQTGGTTIQTGTGLFTVTKQGLTIEVDDLEKLGMVQLLVDNARKKLSQANTELTKTEKKKE